MKYSFDEKIDRTGNHAAKWEEDFDIRLILLLL